MVILALAMIWAAVLVPPTLRARAEARPGASIGRFRRELGVLQRTSPTVVRPADTLRYRSYAAAPTPTYRMARSYSPEAARRARTLRRRRDVLLTLLAAMAGTLVLGFLPGLRPLLGLHVVLDLLLAGYVALLVRARNIAAEREMKLRFLPRTASPEPAFLLRRSAN